LLAESWDDFGAVELDVGHEGIVGETPAVFQIDAVRADLVRRCAVFSATVAA
jgi:hypothetical protein